MVQIVPAAGLQPAANKASAVQANSAEQSTQSATPPAMEFIEPVAPPQPVAATSVPLTLWGLGAGMLLAGLAAGMWMGSKRADEDSPPAAAVTESQAEVEQPLIRDPYAVRHTGEAAEEPAEIESAEPVGEPPTKTQADERPAAPELPALPAGEPDFAVETTEPATTVGDEAPPPASSATPRRRPPGVLRIDPLEFDGTRLSLGMGASSDLPSAASLADDPNGEVAIVPEASLKVMADNLQPPPAREASLHVRRGPGPTAASQPDSTEQLALRVDSLEVSDMPLVRFVEMVSDMAGVPITLDPAALDEAGVTPLDGVSVQAESATLESVLRDSLSSRRLELVVHDGQATVKLRDGEQRRSIDYEVKDLSGGADASDVAELVKKFVGPSSWHAAGGKGTVAVEGTVLRVQQTQSVHHEILIFCERLRLARGLPPRSRYPAEMLSIASPYARVMAKLDRPTTFTFLPWSRLRDVVDHWQSASQLTILVDWSALRDAELGPAAPIACSAIDRPWREALDGVLEPLGLGWWAVDGQTLQITSREALGSLRRVEFYEIPGALRKQFASRDALIRSLTAELREHTGGTPLEQISLELDEPSGRLILLAPPSAHRHLSRRLGDPTE